MPATLYCPIHREPLASLGPDRLRGVVHGEEYPVHGGIPVLLPAHEERSRVGRQAWADAPDGLGGGGSALNFYNHAGEHDHYFRDQFEETRAEVGRWAGEARVEGPVLEIGSGKGGLQGVGGDYVALDYSFTALASHIAPAHQRVCGTADRLPFPDASFRFVFSITALEHVPRAAEAFEEIDRVLKPGGVAYLWPAWHCVQYNCEGIPVRPYRDLTLRQKLVKLSLPARRHALVKGAASLPARLVRRTAWVLSGRLPTTLRFGKLKPDYETFWLSDSDAASRLDSHEGTLFFHSRGYEMLRPGQALSRQLFARHEPVIARKAANATPAPR